MRRENSAVSREPRGELARGPRRARFQAQPVGAPAAGYEHIRVHWSRVARATSDWHIYLGMRLNVPFRPGVRVAGLAVRSMSYVFDLVYTPNGVLDLTRKPLSRETLVRQGFYKRIHAWRYP